MRVGETARQRVRDAVNSEDANVNCTAAIMLNKWARESIVWEMLREKPMSPNLNLCCPIFSKSFLGETRLIFQSVANRSQSVVATDRKQNIITFLKKNDQAKIGELINLIGLSDSRVRALLREMVNDGTIEKIGKNRYAYYKLKWYLEYIQEPYFT